MDSVAAQHGIAVDRFARVIVGFLKVAGGALAATECPSRWVATHQRFLQLHAQFVLSVRYA